EVSYEKAGWGIATGTVNGKRRILFVGGAHKDDANADHPNATPTLNAMQTNFGGGLLDGYAVLLDGGETLPVVSAAPAPSVAAAAGPSAASFERGAQGK